MADLAFIQQHNMVSYLEKNDGNADFHQILDFLTSSSINFALTVSPTIYASYIKQFWNTASLKTINYEKQIRAKVNGKAMVVSESSVRRDIHLNNKDGTACLTVNEIFENLALMGYETASEKLTFYKGFFSPQWNVEKAITTGASLGAAQDSDNITKTQSTTTLNEPHTQREGSEGHTSGSREGMMEHQFELTANVPITPHDSPLSGVLDLEKEKDAQAMEILRLKKRVKKLERQRKSSTSQPRRRKYGQVKSSDDDLDEEDASKLGRKNDKTNLMLHESDFDRFDDETVDAAITGVSTASAPVTTAGVAISTVEPRTPPTTTTVFDDEDVTIAMAQTLIKMKEEKAKENGVAFKDVEDSSRPEELAEIERIQKEKAAQEEVSMAAIYEEYDTIQASIDVDALFAAKL
ncbi:hypothetical protein Tco_1185317 [Tanacetum coccineum]